MKSTDYLVKSIAGNGSFRAYAVNATHLVQTAHQMHDTWSASSAAFGRSLIGTLLLASAGLKNDAKMTVQIQGDGPVGGIVVEGNAHGTVRGYLQNPHVSLPPKKDGHIDVGTAVGHHGTLTVTQMAPEDKTPYTGSVALVSGELGSDFTYYLAKSQQIPSAVGLSVFVNPDESIEVAGGFMIQVLPGVSDDKIAQVESAVKDLPLVSELLKEGKTPEDILRQLFPGENNLQILDQMPVAYRCNCSKERFAKDLATVNPDQLKQIIDEDHHAEVRCQFCNRKYEFNEAELTKIYNQIKK